MDSYQGTHKRAYVNFGRAGKILLPLGIVLTAVFFVATIVFAILMGISLADIPSNTPTESLPADAIAYIVLFSVSVSICCIGACCLVPGIVFTILSKSFRRKDEENGISYSEFDK